MMNFVTQIKYNWEYLKGLIRIKPSKSYSKCKCFSYFDNCEIEKLVEKHALVSQNPFNDLLFTLDIDNIIKKYDNPFIFDLGCGIGNLERHNIISKNSRVVMVDYSIAFLSQCKDLANNNRNIMLIRADVENLPFRNDVADVIIMVNVFPYIENIKNIVFSVYNILKPGGTLIVIYPLKSRVWEEEFEGVRILMHESDEIKNNIKAYMSILRVEKSYFYFGLPLSTCKINLAEGIVAKKGGAHFEK